jgi:hypothetical protein
MAHVRKRPSTGSIIARAIVGAMFGASLIK